MKVLNLYALKMSWYRLKIRLRRARIAFARDPFDDIPF